MKIEILILQDDREVVHRSVSTVDDDVNIYTAAINAMVNEITGSKRLKHSAPPVAQPIPTMVMPVTDKPVSLDDMKRMIDADFMPSGKKPVEDKSFNIKQLPTIKMDEVLRGANG